MARPVKEVLKDAVDLPEPERLRVVEQLLVSLDRGRDRDVDAAWTAEIAIRSRALKRGTVKPIPWETVRARARRRVRGKS